jgi:hypothetical protein
VVVQKTINDLKERPKDERKVVAGGVAIFVIVVLLGAWSILFFKRIQSGAQQVNLDSGAQDAFNPTATQQAQQAIQQQQSGTVNVNDLYQIRANAAANQVETQQQMQVQQVSGGTDQFGNPASSY